MLREALQVRVELLHLLLVGERHAVLEPRLLQLELPLQEGHLRLGLAPQPPVDLLEYSICKCGVLNKWFNGKDWTN